MVQGKALVGEFWGPKHVKTINWVCTLLNQQHDLCAQHKPDQTGHLPSQIRFFAMCMRKPWILSYPLSVHLRLWLDWADSQADLSFCWAQRSFWWFCHAAGKLKSYMYDRIQPFWDLEDPPPTPPIAYTEIPDFFSTHQSRNFLQLWKNKKNLTKDSENTKGGFLVLYYWILSFSKPWFFFLSQTFGVYPLPTPSLQVALLISWTAGKIWIRRYFRAPGYCG